MERRTGQRPAREAVTDRVRAAVEGSQDRDSLLTALGYHNLELYIRGKTLGVVDLESGKKHRLKTLDPGISAQIDARMAAPAQEPDRGAENRLAGEKEKGRDAEAEAIARETKLKKEEDMEMGPIPPKKERRELIDKGHVEPDPARDLLSHEEWQKQDTGLNRVQQSWRRTMDDFRGRTKDLEERSQDKDDKQR